MSAALTKAIKQAKEILAKKAARATACPTTSIQFGGVKIPALPGHAVLYFQVRDAVKEIKITKAKERQAIQI